VDDGVLGYDAMYFDTYIRAGEPSCVHLQEIDDNILHSHVGGYEDYCLLGCDAL
jgi:hypothetical protein